MPDPISAYPLQWPAGWKRTEAYRRTRAKFGKQVSVQSQYSSSGYHLRKDDLSIHEATERLLAELQRFGVHFNSIVISTNLQLRNDGLPRSGQAQPSDPGVAVYWTKAKQQRCMAIDRYDRVQDNLAAVAATLEAMRAIERHGGAEVLDRAFTGFTALPAPGQTTARGWREVFGFAPGETVSRLRLDGAYRTARSEAHPDKPTGNAETFHAVQRAYEQGCAEVGG